MVRVWGLGFGVWSLGFRVWGLGILGLGILGFRVWGLGWNPTCWGRSVFGSGFGV